MPKQERTLPEGTVTEQAAAWFLRLNDPDCSDGERQSFDAWLRAADRHAEEYRRFQQLWGHLDGLPTSRTAGLRAGRAVRVTAFWAAMALGLGLLVGQHLSQPDTEIEEAITTAVGETRRVVLADGTVVDLNADSRLLVTLDTKIRRIRVEHGEALFTVGDDPIRPFEVRAGNGVLRDIGTSFDVALAGEQVTVGVLEGAVEVQMDRRKEKTLISSGSQITYSSAGLSPLRYFDGEAATAWRSGRFIFRAMPLEEVVAQLNRHHVRKTVLADTSLGRSRVSGIFNIADRDGLLSALETFYALRREETAKETRLVAGSARD